jgi:hypothetical protein
MSEHDVAKPLKDFRPTKKFFVGIDSDGCAFDTMEIKHKECFTPNTIKHWGLQSVSKYAREVSEYVNLYSRSRGANRWPALLEVFDLLADREEVKSRGAQMPNVASLREWIQRETRLGHPALKKEIDRTKDPVLAQALGWSEGVNSSIEDMVKGVPPFPFVRKCLQKMEPMADMMVVSQTPTEALVREWEEHDIARFVQFVCGQEMGTKTEHIAFAAKGKYPSPNILMIGDAPGDQKAAETNGALFYPINPGDEDRSWQRLFEEGLERFFDGTFAGNYQKSLVEEFDTYLPSIPPWKKGKK